MLRVVVRRSCKADQFFVKIIGSGVLYLCNRHQCECFVAGEEQWQLKPKTKVNVNGEIVEGNIVDTGECYLVITMCDSL